MDQPLYVETLFWSPTKAQAMARRLEDGMGNADRLVLKGADHAPLRERLERRCKAANRQTWGLDLDGYERPPEALVVGRSTREFDAMRLVDDTIPTDLYFGFWNAYASDGIKLRFMLPLSVPETEDIRLSLTNRKEVPVVPGRLYVYPGFYESSLRVVRGDLTMVTGGFDGPPLV